MEHEERPPKRVTYWQYLHAVHLYVEDFGIDALRELVRDVRRDLALLVDAHQERVNNEVLKAVKSTTSYRLSRFQSIENTLSLNASASIDGEMTVEDTVPDEAVTPTEQVFQHELRELIEEYLESDSLKPMVKKVMVLRFGIGCSPETLDAIGQQLDRTRERVRQMETEGLGQLKIFLRKKGFTQEELGR